MSASLIGRLESSGFRLSTATVSMSLTGSYFSSESAPTPFHHGKNEIKAIEASCDAYLHKQFSPRSLTNAIERRAA